ncbi:MAG: hypothetical protein FJZ01_03320 [Candidatus Sericytochromatia bacterium]|nr:hypothetical protein [Candidatus Tanganyikabacteria bacterium]
MTRSQDRVVAEILLWARTHRQGGCLWVVRPHDPGVLEAISATLRASCGLEVANPLASTDRKIAGEDLVDTALQESCNALLRRRRLDELPGWTPSALPMLLALLADGGPESPMAIVMPGSPDIARVAAALHVPGLLWILVSDDSAALAEILAPDRGVERTSPHVGTPPSGTAARAPGRRVTTLAGCLQAARENQELRDLEPFEVFELRGLPSAWAQAARSSLACLVALAWRLDFERHVGQAAETLDACSEVVLRCLAGPRDLSVAACLTAMSPAALHEFAPGLLAAASQSHVLETERLALARRLLRAGRTDGARALAASLRDGAPGLALRLEVALAGGAAQEACDLGDRLAKALEGLPAPENHRERCTRAEQRAVLALARFTSVGKEGASPILRSLCEESAYWYEAEPCLADALLRVGEHASARFRLSSALRILDFLQAPEADLPVASALIGRWAVEIEPHDLLAALSPLRRPWLRAELLVAGAKALARSGKAAAGRQFSDAALAAVGPPEQAVMSAEELSKLPAIIARAAEALAACGYRAKAVAARDDAAAAAEALPPEANPFWLPAGEEARGMAYLAIGQAALAAGDREAAAGWANRAAAVLTGGPQILRNSVEDLPDLAFLQAMTPGSEDSTGAVESCWGREGFWLDIIARLLEAGETETAIRYAEFMTQPHRGIDPGPAEADAALEAIRAGEREAAAHFVVGRRKRTSRPTPDGRDWERILESRGVYEALRSALGIEGATERRRAWSTLAPKLAGQSEPITPLLEAALSQALRCPLPEKRRRHVLNLAVLFAKLGRAWDCFRATVSLGANEEALEEIALAVAEAGDAETFCWLLPLFSGSLAAARTAKVLASLVPATPGDGQGNETPG